MNYPIQYPCQRPETIVIGKFHPIVAQNYRLIAHKEAESYFLLLIDTPFSLFGSILEIDCELYLALESR